MAMSAPKESSSSSELFYLQFVSDKRLALARRLFWSVLILTSTTGLVTLVGLSVTYYYQYPSMYNSRVEKKVVPSPIVAVCPNPDTQVMLPSSSDWEDYDDSQVLLLIDHLSGETPILERVIDDNGSLFLQLRDAQLVDVMSDFTPSQIYAKLSNFTLINKWLAPYYYMRSSSRRILERIKLINKTHLIDMDKEYVPFLKKFGVDKSYWLKKIKFKKGGTSHYTYSKYTSEYVTSNGGCILFSHWNGSDLEFNNMQDDNYITVYMRHKYRSYYIPTQGFSFVAFSDKRDVLDPLFGTSAYQFYKPSIYKEKWWDTTLTRVITRSLLSQPWSAEECIPERQSQCIASCLVAKLMCKMPFLKAKEANGTEYEDIEKPFCYGLANQKQLLYNLVSNCTEECPISCETTSFSIFRRGSLSNNVDYDMARINVQSRLVHEIYQQEKLYSITDLFSEVGGYLGLTVGASLISVYQLLDYISVRAFQMMIGKASAPNTDRRGIWKDDVRKRF